MVGIQGIGGAPEPKPERPSSVRERRTENTNQVKSSGDGVKISPEAQEAATVSKVVQLAKSESDVRIERVEAAKASIERGDYKNPEIVAQVAQRVSKYLA